MATDIKVSVRNKDVLAISLLENLQGTLKTLSDENYLKLKNEILEDGFSFAVHVFEDLESGKIYIIDGHQRITALKRMKDEGFNIPQIPVVFVEADNLDHAKRKVLAAASQYGNFNQSGAEQFIKTINGIDIDFLKQNWFFEFKKTTERFSIKITKNKTTINFLKIFVLNIHSISTVSTATISSR